MFVQWLLCYPFGWRLSLFLSPNTAGHYLKVLLPRLCFMYFAQLFQTREGVGTSNFTTTTGHFFHYIENGFLVDHYYVITTSKMAF